MCLGFEGDLVTIKNEKQMEFLSKISSEVKNESIWIGLIKRLKDGKCVWSDGTPYNSSVYSNWRSGTTNYTFGKVGCVALYNNSWVDRSCTSVKSIYICERRKGEELCLTSVSVQMSPFKIKISAPLD